MQFAKVPIRYFDEVMNVLFVTLDPSDKELYSSLTDDNVEERHKTMNFIAVSATEIYEIDTDSESVSFGMFGKEDAYVAIVPGKDLNEDELTSLVQKVLPVALKMPIWIEMTEIELALLVEDIDAYFSEKDEYESFPDEKKDLMAAFHTYQIPSLNSLLNFTSLNGTVVEKNGVLYLQTSKDMSEFFNELQTSIYGTTVVIPSVGEMLQKIKTEEVVLER